MDITTFRISKKSKQRLRKHEIHPRETDEQIFLRILDNFEAHEEMELNNTQATQGVKE